MPPLPLLRDCETTSIHPTTGQALSTGILPAGTLILDPGEAMRRIDESFLDEVVVRVLDSRGFCGLERFFSRDLIEATRTLLPTENAPPSKEPVTFGGVYELEDGTFARIRWSDGEALVSARVPAEQACLL